MRPAAGNSFRQRLCRCRLPLRGSRFQGVPAAAGTVSIASLSERGNLAHSAGFLQPPSLREVSRRSAPRQKEFAKRLHRSRFAEERGRTVQRCAFFFGIDAVFPKEIFHGVIQQTAFRDACLPGEVVKERDKLIFHGRGESRPVFQKRFGHCFRPFAFPVVSCRLLHPFCRFRVIVPIGESGSSPLTVSRGKRPAMLAFSRALV